jgi:hypothetical protein
MMVPKKSLILAGAALALFGASTSAQSQSGKVFARYNKPLKSATLDLATGTITRGPAVNNRSATTTVDFNNNDLGGFVGVDTGNGFCEWFDAGVKGQAGNASNLMNDVVFAYCSAMLAAGSGGPGGSVKMGFYEGYTVFGGAPSTAVAVFTLTGLPANSASSSFFGGFNCFFIRVFFGSLVSFADGPIGYSWKFIDVGTDGTLGGTWPFLSCVTSCSGAILQVDGTGMTDLIDEYCPPGTLRATFTFGTVSGSFTSMSMDVREVTDFTATFVDYNSTITANPDILTGSKAIVGGTWTATVTRFVGTFTSATLTVRPTRIPLPNGVQGPPPLPIGAGGRILTSGPVLSTLPGAGIGAVRSFAANVPASFGLVCIHFAGQATCLGGGVKVSSATEGTTGTHP